MKIRAAQLKDLEQILSIYNYEVEGSTATFDLQKKTLNEQKTWFDMHTKNGYPIIVAEDGEIITGYASLSPYRDKEAYKTTAEISVYVSKDFRKKGIATLLMKEIISIAKKSEQFLTIISVITSENQASIHMHQKLGFEFCGTIKRVGKKFGRFLNIDNYCLFTDN